MAIMSINIISSFQTAINLNNEGAALFANGEEILALHRFRNALETIKSDLPSSSSSSPVDGGTTRGILSAPHHLVKEDGDGQVRVKDRPHISQIHIPCGPATDATSCDDASFVYTCALVVQADYDSQGLARYNEQSDVDFLSAIVIFNMALLHDLRGRRYNLSRCRIISLQLYEMCMELLKHQDPNNIDNAAFLSVVCLNNSSQIDFDQGDFQRCQQSLDRLQQLIVCCEANPVTNQLSESDSQGLILNVMMSRYPPTSARAA